jgi:hypothetical protein
MCDLQECQDCQLREIKNGTDEQFAGIWAEMEDIQANETNPRQAAERFANWLWSKIFG